MNQWTCPPWNWQFSPENGSFVGQKAYVQVYTLVVSFREGNNFVKQSDLDSMLETFNAKSRSELIVMRGAPLWGKGVNFVKLDGNIQPQCHCVGEDGKILDGQNGGPKVLEMMSMTYTYLHPGNWSPEMEVWKMLFLLNWVILRFHFNFRESIYMVHTIPNFRVKHTGVWFHQQ